MSNRQFQTLREAGVSLSGIRPRFAPVRNEGNLMNPGSDFLAAVIGNTGPLGAKVTEITALGVSTVYACADYIAKIVATLPLDLYVRRNGRRVPAEGHPARDVLRNTPNPLMTSAGLRYSLAFNQALHGNAYGELINDNGGRLARIDHHRAPHVQIRFPVNSEFPIYLVRTDSGTRTITYDRMMHLRGMSADGICGLSPVRMVADLIGLAQALQDNSSRFFANGSRPGMVYTAAPGVVLTPEQRSALKEQLNAAYQGVENFFRTMVLEGGGKMEMTRSANDSSQFDEIAKRTHQQICQIFGVPPHKVGILDNATFSNIEEQQIQAMQDLIGPWCTQWEQSFAGALLTRRERETHYWKHNLTGLLRGDVVKRTQAQSVWLQNGVLSINQVRELEDMDPIEGGDKHYHQLNMIDITAPDQARKEIPDPASA